MIRLEPVCESNFRKVVDMKLTAEQSRFVAPNVVSIAQAWLYYDEARPFAICDDEEVVGFIMLDWDEGERTVGIWRFMIATEHQHKGFGRAAMELAIKLVRDAGRFDLMHLDYVPGNTAARALYASMGFRENGKIEDGEIIMTLPLTDDPRVGMLTADSDDMDDFTSLLSEAEKAGIAIPDALADSEALASATDSGQVKRLTLMGDTIGIAAFGELLIAGDKLSYLDEARAKLADSGM